MLMIKDHVSRYNIFCTWILASPTQNNFKGYAHLPVNEAKYDTCKHGRVTCIHRQKYKMEQRFTESVQKNIGMVRVTKLLMEDNIKLTKDHGILNN